MVRVTVGEEFETEEEFEIEERVVEEVPEEEVSVSGDAIATLAYGLDFLEGILLAEAEALGEELSGGGVIPFGFMVMPEPLAEGTLLGDIFKDIVLKIGDQEIKLEDQDDTAVDIVVSDGMSISLTYSWNIEDGVVIRDGDYAIMKSQNSLSLMER